MCGFVHNTRRVAPAYQSADLLHKFRGNEHIYDTQGFTNGENEGIIVISNKGDGKNDEEQ